MRRLRLALAHTKQLILLRAHLVDDGLDFPHQVPAEVSLHLALGLLESGVVAQPDRLRQLFELLLHQRFEPVQPRLLRGIIHRQPAQLGLAGRNPVARPHIGGEIVARPGDQVSALAGFAVEQRLVQGMRRVDRVVGMTNPDARFLELLAETDKQQRDHHEEHGQRHADGDPGVRGEPLGHRLQTVSSMDTQASCGRPRADQLIHD